MDIAAGPLYYRSEMMRKYVHGHGGAFGGAQPVRQGGCMAESALAEERQRRGIVVAYLCRERGDHQHLARIFAKSVDRVAAVSLSPVCPADVYAYEGTGVALRDVVEIGETYGITRAAVACHEAQLSAAEGIRVVGEGVVAKHFPRYGGHGVAIFPGVGVVLYVIHEIGVGRFGRTQRYAIHWDGMLMRKVCGSVSICPK